MASPPHPNPREVEVQGVVMPPLLVSAIIGLIAAWATMRWLDHNRLIRHFPWPTPTFLALTAIYAILTSVVLFPS
jgi:uncharacterized membrane protein YidH (DUF202 family)